MFTANFDSFLTVVCLIEAEYISKESIAQF